MAAAPGDVIRPVGMCLRNLGGRDFAVDPKVPTSGQVGVAGGAGLNNIGLLVKTWGKVTFVDTTNKFFYIDDGYGRLDGSGHTGIRCSYGYLAGVTITPPAQNAYVSVIGVISTVVIDTKVQPNIRPRRQTDIDDSL